VRYVHQTDTDPDPPHDFYPSLSGNRPGQMRAELYALCRLLQQLDCASWLEVGCREGDAFHAVASMLPRVSREGDPRATRMVAIELPEQLWGRTGTLPMLERAADAARALGHEVAVLALNSQDAETARRAAALGPFDAVLIDADHSYRGVRRDWALYGPLARKICCFHDIHGEGQTTTAVGPSDAPRVAIEVPRLWREIVDAGVYATLEIRAPGSKMGIGVVFMQDNGAHVLTPAEAARRFPHLTPAELAGTLAARVDRLLSKRAAQGAGA
jgi:hypothetical protein